MLGAIVGDVIGSVHEGSTKKIKDFPLFIPQSTFTDDSVLTVAVAEWIPTGQNRRSICCTPYADDYPGRGYGGMFANWATARAREPATTAFSNGAAIRVSPVGFAFETMEDVLAWSRRSAEVTHNHPEGIRGAQATAAAIYLARRVRDKELIKATPESLFEYDLSPRLEEIRPAYGFDATCQGTVPQALAAFFESTTRTQYAMPSRWVGMPTPWRVLQAALPRPTTVERHRT